MESHNKAIELYKKILEFNQQIDNKLVVDEEDLIDIQCLYYLMKKTMKLIEKTVDNYFKN